MKKPLRRTSPVTMTRMSSWTTLFGGYRHAVTEGRIERWLDQFAPEDRDCAVRLLDSVDFITGDQIAAAYRSALPQLVGWDRAKSKRTGKWRFVPYSSSAGESGGSMLHRFRMANGLGSTAFHELFIHKSELLMENLESSDTVVFVDDFAGTGDQACNSWPEFQELLPGNPTSHLVLIAVTTRAAYRIQNETGLVLNYGFMLNESDNVFSPKCKHFTPQEKDSILGYCTKADKNSRRGYGDCGLILVFSHDCPTNSIPILHRFNTRWEGLFRRHI